MIRIASEVRAALDANGAVVALESTVLAHGLPHPRNLEVGRVLEAEVQAGGAVPATIAVVSGRPTVGLMPEEMERIGGVGQVLKLSTRDLPLAVARSADGATTVAATLWLAHRVGIRVFATGGIGGVHRGPLPDVSADITELGRTPMVVVCAGAKAILDLSATREALETAGVLVVGWSTDELPAFYSRESGLSTDCSVESAGELAELWSAHRQLGFPGAILLCVPPPEDHAIPAAEIDTAIRRASEQADHRGVRGNELTPFLLRSVAEHTGGRSLETNVALLKNNARVAARVAVALTEISGES